MADHPCHDPSCTRHPIKREEMGEKTSYNCVKYVFFAFNVCLWLLGCGVLSLGVWLQINRAPHVSVLSSHSFLSASTLCITAGAIVLFVGFLGCCGAFYENQCMLIGYFIVVLLIFLLEITAGTLAFMHKEELRSVIQQDLLVSLQQDYRPPPSQSDSVSRQPTHSDDQEMEDWWQVMDSLQAQLHCCGVHNYSDYYNIRAWPTERRVPDSCCRQPQSDCGLLGPTFWFDRGCIGEIDYWFVRNMYILGVVGITVAVVQILGMVAALVLFCYIRNNKFFM